MSKERTVPALEPFQVQGWWIMECENGFCITRCAQRHHFSTLHEAIYRAQQRPAVWSSHA